MIFLLMIGPEVSTRRRLSVLLFFYVCVCGEIKRLSNMARGSPIALHDYPKSRKRKLNTSHFGANRCKSSTSEAQSLTESDAASQVRTTKTITSSSVQQRHLRAPHFVVVRCVMPGCEHGDEVIIHRTPSGKLSVTTRSSDFLATPLHYLPNTVIT